jgi:hypothetical protein
MEFVLFVFFYDVTVTSQPHAQAAFLAGASVPSALSMAVL